MITQNPLGLPGAQNAKIWMARALVGLQPAPAHQGGYAMREIVNAILYQGRTGCQ